GAGICRLPRRQLRFDAADLTSIFDRGLRRRDRSCVASAAGLDEDCDQALAGQQVYYFDGRDRRETELLGGVRYVDCLFDRSSWIAESTGAASGVLQIHFAGWKHHLAFN